MYLEKGGLMERVGGGKVFSTLRVKGFRVNHFFPPNRQFGYRKSGVPMAMYNGASKKKQEEGGTSKVIQSLMREPLSFWGGVFAGFLALDLEQGEYENIGKSRKV